MFAKLIIQVENAVSFAAERTASEGNIIAWITYCG